MYFPEYETKEEYAKDDDKNCTQWVEILDDAFGRQFPRGVFRKRLRRLKNVLEKLSTEGKLMTRDPQNQKFRH